MPATNAITIAFKQTAAGRRRAKDVMDVRMSLADGHPKQQQCYFKLITESLFQQKGQNTPKMSVLITGPLALACAGTCRIYRAVPPVAAPVSAPRRRCRMQGPLRQTRKQC